MELFKKYTKSYKPLQIDLTPGGVSSEWVACTDGRSPMLAKTCFWTDRPEGVNVLKDAK